MSGDVDEKEWQCYRLQCEARSVFSRFALETSIAMLRNADCHEWLKQVLRSGRILPKPESHLGGPESDFFSLRFNRSEVAELLAGLEPDLCDLSPGKAQHLVICWQEYLESFSDGH